MYDSIIADTCINFGLTRAREYYAETIKTNFVSWTNENDCMMFSIWDILLQNWACGDTK